MAKIKGPLFSMEASGSFGEIVFDRRGYARLKRSCRDPQTADQGNARQALMMAQQCVKICGPTTRQQLKAEAEDPSTWHLHLVKALIGAQRATYSAYLQQFMVDAEVDQAGWEGAAGEAGLQPLGLPYADEPGPSPGAQLFVLASTLHDLGLYPGLGSPNGNAAAWKDQIIA